MCGGGGLISSTPFFDPLEHATRFRRLTPSGGVYRMPPPLSGGDFVWFVVLTIAVLPAWYWR
jgi:hypothetical protein